MCHSTGSIGDTPIGPFYFLKSKLHMIVVAICAVVCFIVFGIMCYSIIYHRKSHESQATPFHKNTISEIIWSIIPLFILIGLAIPAVYVFINSGKL
jgi:cytochrome c oxidase subunit 2